MGRYFCFFIFAFIFNLNYYVPSSLASPIIGGIEDTDFKNKHHVAIHRKDQGGDYTYICGGTILQEKYVISAAHCFLMLEHGQKIQNFDLLETPVKVTAGTNRINGLGVERDVVKIFIPKEYDRRPGLGAFADMSMLQLSQNLGVAQNPNSMKKLGIGDPDNYSVESIRGSYCGYGYYEGTRDNNGKFVASKYYSKTNRCLDVDILGIKDSFFKNDHVAAYYYYFAVGTDKTKYTASCEGDSGAGLIVEGQIVGVLSRGPTGCKSGTPTQFTRIYEFACYIISVLTETVDQSHMDIFEVRRSHQSSPHHGEKSSSSGTKTFQSFLKKNNNNKSQ